MNVVKTMALERRKMLESKKKRRGYQNVRQLLPKNIMLRYYGGLREYIDSAYSIVKEVVIQPLPLIYAEKQQEEGVATDAYVESIEQMIATMTRRLDTRDTINVDAMLLDIGQRTAKWNDKEWQKVIRAAYGVSTYSRKPWLNDRLTIFTRENVSLIKSIETDLHKNVESIVRHGLDGGLRHEAVAKEIKNTFDVQKKRAKLIARDQVSKLNGKIAEQHQREVGVEVYIWETSDDARVRTYKGKSTKGHRFLDGKFCRWDDASVYSEDGKTWVKKPSTVFQGHPGQDFQCRCWANPVFEEYAGL